MGKKELGCSGEEVRWYNARIMAVEGLVRNRVIAIVLAVVTVGMLAWFVWPTPYTYMNTGGEFSRVLRIRRYDGRTWVLTSQGWRLVRTASK